MSVLALRIIASICMLLDHIGYCCGFEIPRYIGRLAFPIYMFLMVNGFHHTKNRTRYALRLALFALLSQIPFSLMCYGRAFHPRLNVMATLLMGLLAIWAGEVLRQHKKLRYICLLPGMLLYGVCFLGWIESDYDCKGIIMAVFFWYFYGKKPWIAVGLFLGIWNYNIVSFIADVLYGRETPAPTQWQMTQMLSLLSLPLIYLYNGKPGTLPQSPTGKKWVQLAFYAFYPVHMLALWFLFRL